MTWTPHVTVAAVVESRQGFLLVSERNSRGEIVLNQPAGHLEDGESLLQAVIREVLEETMRPFQPAGLVGIYRYPLPHRQRTYLRFCFHGSVGDPIPGRKLDADILDTHWLEPGQLDQWRLRSPMVRLCMTHYRTRPSIPLHFLHDLEALG